MSLKVPPAAGPGAEPPLPVAGPPPAADEPPPILGSWGRMYFLVLAVLALAVLLFAWLGWSYR